jgi:hypothetical protein
MQQSKADQGVGADQAPAFAARRYVEFTLYSSPDSESNK